MILRLPGRHRLRGFARDDAGAATALATMLIGLLLFVGLALGVVAAAVLAHRQAQSAADLAALAGAHAVQQRAEPCAAAAAVAQRNRARLTGCSRTGQEVVVTVRVRGPRWAGHGFRILGRARAGPG